MKKGFTLIELLVVVLIIGILSAIALPQYQKAVTRSRMAEQFTLLGSIYPAAQACLLENENDVTKCTTANLPVTATCKPIAPYTGSCAISILSVTDPDRNPGPRVRVTHTQSGAPYRSI